MLQENDIDNDFVEEKTDNKRKIIIIIIAFVILHGEYV